MLVSFFSLQMFTSRSSPRAFSPTIIPSYTASPGSVNITPRSCRPNIANVVATPVRSATRLPRVRVRISPCHGSQPSNTECSSPVPRVSVRNSVRNPTSPRAGTR